MIKETAVVNSIGDMSSNFYLNIDLKDILIFLKLIPKEIRQYWSGKGFNVVKSHKYYLAQFLNISFKVKLKTQPTFYSFYKQWLYIISQLAP